MLSQLFVDNETRMHGRDDRDLSEAIQPIVDQGGLW